MTKQHHYDLLLQTMIDQTQAEKVTPQTVLLQADDLDQAAYAIYRRRWQLVPGDHAPGRLLTIERWRELMLELAQEMEQAQGGELSRRATVLHRALLLV